MTNRTFAIIKPDAVKNNYTGKIYNHILEKGFTILSAKLIKMSKYQAEQFYFIHKNKPFYEELTNFMSSGPIIPLIIEKENAVSDFRELIGATDPTKAEPGTIRALFAKSMSQNAIHGSDSVDNAKIEADYFFSIRERY